MKNSIDKIPADQYFNYSYGRYISNGVLVLGTIGGLIGIKCFDLAFSNNLLWLIPGIVLILVGVFLFIPTELLQINFTDNTYRNSIKIFSHLYGEWKDLGEVKYLSIIRINKSIMLSDQNARYAKGDVVEECQLRLYIRPGEHIIIDDYEKKSSALQIGKIIARSLQVDILDATESPAVFINLEEC